MKHTVTVILVICIVAAAAIAYVYRAHEKAAQLRAEDAQFSAQPGATPARADGEANAPTNSPDLVHQLPAGASAIVFADVSVLRAAPI
ncbi:MAG: hypothetical protein ACRD37_04795, partial [Candidatus Acidiferrales bacterium]